MAKSFSKRTAELLNTVRAYIIDKDLIRQGERVCVGVSGGADSLCLLQVLYELKEKTGTDICAFHVNHCLRGAESEADQEFTEQFCRERGIPVYIYRYDVAGIAAREKRGIEETGRILRKKAAAECMKSAGADKVALAHHKNDCVETMLFNLARGTSLAGLKGIAPKTGAVIRPLLCCTRDDIEDFLNERKIGWRTDSSNLKTDYVRNRIRHCILPLFEEEINGAGIRHMAAAAADIGEADELIRRIAFEKSASLVKKTKDGLVILPEIKDTGGLLGGYIIMEAFRMLAGTQTNIGREHILTVRELFGKQPGKCADLPYGVTACRIYEGVALKKEDGNAEAALACEGPVKLRIPGRICFSDMVFETRIIEGRPDPEKIPKKKYTKWFDCDKIRDNCVLRHKKAGDHLLLGKENHRKKLKKFFTDEKIPADERDSVVCLADDDLILWAVGYRISECCKVTEETKRILEIRVSGGIAAGDDAQIINTAAE